ncbi:MAG: hypothetical protein ACE5NN_05340 [Candidatus Bathyarchaeia archaeon]
MDSPLLAEHIAVIGVCIFAALFNLVFFRKEVFQNDESKSIKVQIIYLLAAVFGLLLVRNEFAPIWGDMRFPYSLAYLYFSLANIPAIILYIVFLRRQKLPKYDAASRSVKEKGTKKKRKEGRKRKRKGEKATKTRSPTKRERGKEKIEKRDRREKEERERKEETGLIQQAQEILNF